MILIVSNASDASTTDIIDWCLYLEVPYFLITEELLISEVELFIDEEYAILEFIDGTKLDTRSVTGFWYRRKSLYYFLDFFQPLKNQAIEKHLIDEWKITVDYLFHLFQKKKCFSDYFKSDINKLLVLEKANKIGIKTPKTIIASKKDSLVNVLGSKYINKTIHNIINYSEDGTIYTNRTIKGENLVFPSAPFFPSLFQSEINKKYEVRTFFLNGKTSSVAIFSQSDPQTQSDFREYNFDFPNRCVPFNLPDTNKIQIIQLMKELDLMCGSIDFLVDESDELIFLEINPVGQFGMISNINNDPLEMEMCNNLI